MVSRQGDISQGPWIVRLPSVGRTEALGQAIGCELRGGEVIALFGDLGAGKTVLVRGIASGLGIKSTEVTSPTFTLIHFYKGRIPLVHVDLYRVDKPGEVDQIGIQEYFSKDTTVVIEWAEHMEGDLPRDHLAIYLKHVKPTVRLASLNAMGQKSQELLIQVRHRFSL